MLSWPPLENLLAPLRSSRYSFLWRGTRSRSYTEIVPDPPDISPGRTCIFPVLKIDVFSHTPHIFFLLLTWSLLLQYLTLSFMSLAMSKCLWQQTTASSNRPKTFNVLPRFPLALASPSRSPIVLTSTHHLSNNKYIMLAGLWSSHAGPTWSRWGHAGGTPGP